MIVRLLRPDSSLDEWDCPDVEQLLFLLRLVPTLRWQGRRYRFESASLLIDQGNLSIEILVSNDTTAQAEIDIRPGAEWRPE